MPELPARLLVERNQKIGYSKESLLSETFDPMLAKLTSKNQLTLPKGVTNAIGAVEYFEVKATGGQIILTPVRIQRADAVRAKLAELDIAEQDVPDAVAWSRKPVRRAK